MPEVEPETDTQSRKVGPPPAYRRIAAVAARQDEVISLAQLRAAGVLERCAQRWARQGRLRRLHRGVFSLAAGRVSAAGRRRAAVLACGEGAVLSHRSAAEQWGLLRPKGSRVHVTTIRAHGRRRAGVVGHRARRLLPDDVTVVQGLPCTSIARTLLDLAATAPRHELERAIREADFHRRLDLTAIDSLIARCSGHRGVSKLNRALKSHRPHGRYRSGSEIRFHELWKSADLPELEVAPWVPFEEGGGVEPDFVWRTGGIAIEIDERASHARVAAFEEDRRRDRRVLREGLQTLRFTAREVWQEPERLVRESRSLVRDRR